MAALAIVAALPIILFPAALVWFINVGGAVHALRTAKREAAVETGR